MKIDPTVRPGRVPEKRRTGQDRTVQSNKSQRRYISPSLGEDPTQPIFAKICVMVAISDIITWAKFGTKIFRGYESRHSRGNYHAQPPGCHIWHLLSDDQTHSDAGVQPDSVTVDFYNAVLHVALTGG